VQAPTFSSGWPTTHLGLGIRGSDQRFFFQFLKVTARLIGSSQLGRVYYVAIVAIVEMKQLVNKIFMWLWN
jgi:hypothetical protein